MKHYPDAAYLLDLAQKAGQIIRANFSLGMLRSWKPDETPLTVTDTAVNQLVLETLGRDFPHVRVLAEEGNSSHESAEFTVMCDPVDGTIPFSLGVPVTTFCISVIAGNTPLSAAIHDPFEGRTWTAEKGKGTVLRVEGRGLYEKPTINPVKVSNHQSISLSNSCMIWWQGSQYNLHEVCAKLMAAGGKWINPASVAYFGGLIATGTFEASIFPSQNGLETAAMQLVVEEAGGKATDIYGNPLEYDAKGKIRGHIISNGHIHDQLVELIRSCQPPT